MHEGERQKFIGKHAKEIQPLVSGSLPDVEHMSDGAAKEVLETFETKVATFDNPHAKPGSARILLEAAQTANANVLNPLLDLLEADTKFAGATLISDNVGGARLMNDRAEFRQVRTDADEPVLADIPAGPYASALVIDEPYDSPASMLMASAKEVYGAERLAFLSLGLFVNRWEKPFRNVDVLLTTDAFTAGFARTQGVSPDLDIQEVGSPLIDGIDPEKGSGLGIRARAALGIPEDAHVVFYSSTIPAAFREQGGRDDINTTTYDDTLRGVREAALREPTKTFVLIRRMHPAVRGTYAFPEDVTNIPENLRIVDGDALSYDEAIYASDLICCTPTSTEVIAAGYRGKRALMLAYEGGAQFGEVLTALYGSEGNEYLRTRDDLSFIATSTDMANALIDTAPIPPRPKPARTSIERIRDILLAPTI